MDLKVVTTFNSLDDAVRRSPDGRAALDELAAALAAQQTLREEADTLPARLAAGAFTTEATYLAAVERRGRLSTLLHAAGLRVAAARKRLEVERATARDLVRHVLEPAQRREVLALREALLAAARVNARVQALDDVAARLRGGNGAGFCVPTGLAFLPVSLTGESKLTAWLGHLDTVAVSS